MATKNPTPLLYQLRDGSLSDPYVDKVENIKLVAGKVVLDEIPVKQFGVIVDGHIETSSNTPSGNSFYVDYNYGVIYFEPEKVGTVTVRYRGRGFVNIPADRVLYSDSTTNQTLGLTLNLLNDKVSDAEAKGNVAEEKGVFSKEQGDYAKVQGDHAKTQGDYALSKGNEAKTNADSALAASVLANEKATLADDAAHTAFVNWLEPVNLFSDIATIYPSPEHGDQVQVLETGDLYRFHDGVWINHGFAPTSPPNLARKNDRFVATENQRLFTTSKPYFTNQDRLDVFVSGVKQVSGVDYEETSSNSFTLVEGAHEGEIVEAVYLKTTEAQALDLIDKVVLAEAATVAANTAKEEALSAATSTKLIWKDPVANFAALSTTYPTAVFGWTAATRDNGRIFRFDGTSWRWIQDVDMTAYNALDTKLTSQLAETTAQLDGLEVAKADLSYVSNQLSQRDASIASLESSKMEKDTTDIGVYQINKDKGKIDETYLAQSLLTQIAGNAPISATLGSRTLTSSVFSFRSVTPELLSFVKQSKNLFDKTVYTDNTVVNMSDGTLQASTGYVSSDFIPVLPNTTYSRSSAYNTGFYNKDRQFISSNAAGRQFTTPANTAFVRVSFGKTLLNTYQLELGNAETAYEPYKVYTDVASKLIFSKDFIESNFEEIPSTKTDLMEPGKNLFDQSSATTGFYVDFSNGTLLPNAEYFASDFIAVTPNESYTINFNGQMAWYDANKAYIGGVTGNGTVAVKTIVAPPSAAFARFSTKNKQTFQVERGLNATTYEAFKYVVKSSKLPQQSTYEAKKEFLLFLPPEICVAVGRTIELYNNQVAWTGNIEDYHFKWDCQIGKNLKRKFSVTGATVGNYPLTLTVYDSNMMIVASASTTVKIVSNVLATTRTVLTIGDSLTNTTSSNKPWMSEIRTLSNNKINFVGTRGLAANLMHEGRSGFTAGQYLAATAYPFEGEGTHPFWNPSTSSFDFGYYKAQTGITPDVVNIFLGTNGIALDPTTNANNIKTIVDKIRQNDANIPVYVTFTLYRGNQNGLGVQTSNDGFAANRGAWKLEEDRKVFNLMVRLYDLLKNYTNLYFIPISLSHDSEYNFGAVSTPVNPRASQTELMPTEATHPQNQGYLQFADIIFSVYAAHMN